MSFWFGLTMSLSQTKVVCSNLNWQTKWWDLTSAPAHRNHQLMPPHACFNLYTKWWAYLVTSLTKYGYDHIMVCWDVLAGQGVFICGKVVTGGIVMHKSLNTTIHTWQYFTALLPLNISRAALECKQQCHGIWLKSFIKYGYPWPLCLQT